MGIGQHGIIPDGGRALGSFFSPTRFGHRDDKKVIPGNWRFCTKGEKAAKKHNLN